MVRMAFSGSTALYDTFRYLISECDVEWERVTAFQVDEFIGLARNSSRLYQAYLDEYLFSKVRLGRVFRINAHAPNVPDECRRYGDLVSAAPIDILFLEVGENGHLASNDPATADFGDPEFVKVSKLDGISRRQQVNDGRFEKLRAVPRFAYTLTIPALFAASHILACAPGIRKAEAVRCTLIDPVSEACPSTVLTRHEDATLFLDNDSASLVDFVD